MALSFPCKNTPPNAQFFLSVNDIPETIWQELKCSDNIYFNKLYLEALEKNNSQVQFSYLVVFDNNNSVVALASLQLIDFYLNSIQNNLQSVLEWVRCMGRKSPLLTSDKPFKVLVCGNVFVSGEHGVFIKPNQPKKEILKQLVKAINMHEKQISKEVIHAFMLKDFVNESLFITDELHKLGYNSFKVDPNMVLSLSDDWNTFDDYLSSLKTKFRVKAKKALKQSVALRVEDVTTNSIKSLLPKMRQLYQTVSTKANFNLGDFNVETYLQLKKNLGDDYVLKTYWLDDKLVGFLSGLFTKDSLDAHFVGIDYTFNRTHAIYQRMLYDYILLGIQNKRKLVSFGRTASEIKSSIGAVPENLTIYLRYRRSVPNKILSVFLKRIQPTEFSQRKPFKQKRVQSS